MVTRIGIVAPSVYLLPHHVERANAMVATHFPDVELVWHPQVYGRAPNEVGGEAGFVFSDATNVPAAEQHGHFAGSDEQRAEAFIEMANRDNKGIFLVSNPFIGTFFVWMRFRPI